MEVPATASMGKPAWSRTCKTPTCAVPRDDPAERTTPTLGRWDFGRE